MIETWSLFVWLLGVVVLSMVVLGKRQDDIVPSASASSFFSQHRQSSDGSDDVEVNARKRKKGGAASGETSDTNVDDDTNKATMFDCRFCDMKFSKSQALGGHMNRHRQEREQEEYQKARQLVASQQIGPQYYGNPWNMPGASNSSLDHGGNLPSSLLAPPLPYYSNQPMPSLQSWQLNQLLASQEIAHAVHSLPGGGLLNQMDNARAYHGGPSQREFPTGLQAHHAPRANSGQLSPRVFSDSGSLLQPSSLGPALTHHETGQQQQHGYHQNQAAGGSTLQDIVNLAASHNNQAVGVGGQASMQSFLQPATERSALGVQVYQSGNLAIPNLHSTSQHANQPAAYNVNFPAAVLNDHFQSHSHFQVPQNYSHSSSTYDSTKHGGTSMASLGNAESVIKGANQASSSGLFNMSSLDRDQADFQTTERSNRHSALLESGKGLEAHEGSTDTSIVEEHTSARLL